MRTRQLTALAILLAITVIFLLKRGGGDTDRQATDFKERQRRETSSPADNQNSREEFDRRIAPVIYTKHARCRMECRDISEEDISEIMQKGIINFGMSNRSDKPCPTFALQGRTSSGEKLRIIFAQCHKETKVVTCYNLEENPVCDCPGDRN